MEPIEITWPGSTDRITIRMLRKLPEETHPVGDFLASRFQQYWPPQQHVSGGPFLSVKQDDAWRARIGDAHNLGGFVLVARHTSSNGGIVAAIVCEPVAGERVSRVVIQSQGGYEAATVDPAMLSAAKRECELVGLPLARPVTHWELLS